MTVTWLHLDRIPFEQIMTEIAYESLTDLRSCTQVCTAWSDLIQKHIFENLHVMHKIRDKMERAFGRFALDQTFYRNRNLSEIVPTCELISNAKWLSK